MGCIKSCGCDFTMENTGIDCTPLIHVTKKLLYMPIFDSTGTRNYINASATVDAAVFTALINQSDNSKRLFPLPEMKDIKDLRGDAIKEEFPDGSSIHIRDNTRTFDSLIVGRDGSPLMKGKIESARCGEMGVYLVTRKGDLVGTKSDDNTKLYPIRLDSESLSAVYIKETDTTSSKLQVKFNFHPDEDDNCLGIILNSEMDSVNLLLLKGLVNVFVEYSGLSTTTITAKLYTESGTMKKPTVVQGLVVADFTSSVGGATSKVRNTTDNADVALTSVTEGTLDDKGKYALVFAAQTSGDEIVLLPKKDGFDFTAVGLNPTNIP